MVIKTACSLKWHVHSLVARCGTKNATLIVDIDNVLFTDLKANDLGTWMNNGTKSTYFTMLPNGSIWIASGKLSQSMKSSCYHLTPRYFTHGTYNLFCRIVIDIQGMYLSLFELAS